MSYDVLSNLIVTNVFSASTMYTEEKTNYKKINREKWAIVFKSEGETVYTQNGKDFVSNANNIVILPKGSSYDWECIKSGHFIIIEFEADAEYNNIFSFPVKNGEKYLTAFKRIEYITTLKSFAYTLEAIRDIYSIILMLLQTSKVYLPNEKKQKILPALEYIAKNYNNPISNEQLASLVGMSCVWFRKVFAETVGESPIAYARSLRIKKAREMLNSDYISISNIAYSLGYSSVYAFSRDFKKHTGKSPSKY